MNNEDMPALPTDSGGFPRAYFNGPEMHAYARAYAEQEVAKELKDIDDWCEAFAAQVDDLGKVQEYIRSRGTQA